MPFMSTEIPSRLTGKLVSSSRNSISHGNPEMNEIYENDILANKLMAMTDRRDPKDYVDVYFILQDYPSMKIEDSIRQQELEIVGLVIKHS